MTLNISCNGRKLCKEVKESKLDAKMENFQTAITLPLILLPTKQEMQRHNKLWRSCRELPM